MKSKIANLIPDYFPKFSLLIRFISQKKWRFRHNYSQNTLDLSKSEIDQGRIFQNFKDM